MTSTPVSLTPPETTVRSWTDFEAGSLVVVARDRIVELPDDPIAGCAPDLAPGLETTPIVDLSRGLPGLPAGADGKVGASVRSLLPVVIEAVGDGTFHVCGRHGDALRVDATVATVIAACRRPVAVDRVDAFLAADDHGWTVDDLRAAGLLALGGEARGEIERRVVRNARAHARLDRRLSQVAAPVTDETRVPVHGVWVRSDMDEWMPLALGCLVAVVREPEALRSRYGANLLIPRSVDHLHDVAAKGPAGIYLFSDYVWNLPGNLALTNAVKAASADHLTIHGGPSVPVYPADRVQFLADNPHIDVLVHGEGEAAMADILDRVAEVITGDRLTAADAVDAVRGLPGTTVRSADGTVSGPPRERIADLSTIPSPFLTGVFDDLIDVGLRRIVLETNRGCPFHCAFCDWGSATKSRIRTFPLDRVLAEIDWVADRGADFLILGDANFGMLPRDVEIAAHLADRHDECGAPAHFGSSMAKNPNQRFAEIVRRLNRSDLLLGAGLSLQTYDEGTLAMIDRENIPRERYDAMWETFRSVDIPMGAEFMIGLPGCTRTTFATDLQFAVDRELYFLVHRTRVLPNAPMNAPDYRDQHGLVTDETGHLLATSTYTEADLRTMLADYQAVYGADHLGALRIVLRFLRHRTGRTEVDLAVELGETARARRSTMPCVRWFLTAAGRWGCPPAGWDRFLAEVREWAVDHLDIADDAVLTSVLSAQRAAIPHPTVDYPVAVELEHDVARWFADAQEAKLDDGGWTAAVEDLATYGPATLVVDDPWAIRENLALLAKPHGTSGWELDSPFKRPGTESSILVT